MTRRFWRTVGPWATPVVVAVEIGLAVSGLLAVRTAVITGLAIEAMLWITAISSATSAVRRYRSARRKGLDGWAAAEDGLARLVPRPVARVLLIEPRLLACLARWVSGRHGGSSPDAFSYHRGIRPLLGAILALVICEGVVVDVVIALVFPGGLWVWVVLGAHLYALVWLAGFLASMVVKPHLLCRDGLAVRDGIFNELFVPYTAIRAARAVSHPNFGRSGFKVDPAAGAATLAVGDANVTIDLDPTRLARLPPGARSLALRSLRITVDKPAEFVAALLARTSGSSSERSVPRPVAGADVDLQLGSDA